MRVCEVVGTVTLVSSHPSLSGGSYRLAVPLSLACLKEGAPITSEELVVYDELGAGLGSRIAVSEGAEAAQPFKPQIKPIDAYNAAILDQINF